MKRFFIKLTAILALIALICLSFMPLSPIALVLTDHAGKPLGFLFTLDWLLQEGTFILDSVHPLSGGSVREIYGFTEDSLYLKSALFQYEEDALAFSKALECDIDARENAFAIIPLDVSAISTLALYCDAKRDFKLTLGETTYLLSDFGADQAINIAATRFSLIEYLVQVLPKQ